ncbi:MAG TPA: efflux RND transporter periplasmic adaptor subunit [Rhodocyclaceae bacterium]|nr:efflux RND transporter periplasmic adaptor subunit [Rhodocyclaceae bacterium]
MSGGNQPGRGIALAVALVSLAALSATGGYWLGGRGGEQDAVAKTVPAAAPEAAKQERKPLYYRNPMGLPDTSPTPKKDSMGMDYIPVYPDEQSGQNGQDGQGGAPENQIRISTAKVQKLGVKTEVAGLRSLDRVVRASGRIEPDERRIYDIAPRFEGYIERLLVNATGQPVRKGQPLFEVYSPELVSAQREYAIAARGVESLKGAGGEAQAGMQALADASLARLKNWDISAAQVKALAKSGEARRSLSFLSPVTGVVTEKKAQAGMRFMPGDTLYRVTDLSTVWVLADVFEQDIGSVRSGAQARIGIDAYPGKDFAGAVSYVYPTLNSQTRTVPVRIHLSNPGGLLKPGMFAQVELPVGSSAKLLAVPVSAVIDSGTRAIVLVQAGEGRFEPRPVKLGARSDDYVEVRDGLQAGERVVVAANFLIDAESNLQAAISGFSGASQGGKASTEPAAGH